MNERNSMEGRYGFFPKKSILGVVLALLCPLISISTANADGFIDPARPAVGKTFLQFDEYGTIEFVTSGDTEAFPGTIVLLASLGRSVSDYNELVARLNEAGYRTIAVQARDVGQSAGNPETLQDYAEDIRKVLDAAKVPEINKIHIIGHAFGNRIARVFSTRYPAKVRSVILLAAGGQYDLPDELRRELLRILNPLLPDEVRRPCVQRFMFDDANIAPQWWVDGWYTGAAWGQRNANYAEDSLPYQEWGAGGVAPMLVIEGESDRTAAPYEIPDGEEYRITIRKISGAAHALLPEKPEQISAEILSFLASL